MTATLLRASKVFGDFGEQKPRARQGVLGVAPVGRQDTAKLIDGFHRLNGNLARDFIEERVVRAPEQIRPLRNKNNVGANASDDECEKPHRGRGRSRTRDSSWDP